jgi:hypothetical protein
MDVYERNPAPRVVVGDRRRGIPHDGVRAS